MLKLYYLQGACPLVPHTALHWAGAKFEAVRLERGQQKSPEFLALNPRGSVPLLTDGEWALSQNAAIMEYLNTLYPQARIFGSGDAREQALARQWFALANSDLHSNAFSKLFGAANLTGQPEAQQDIARNATAAINSIYAQADQALSQRDYLAGAEITAADVYFYVTERWAQKFQLDLSGFTHLAAHFQRVENNSGVQAALSDQGLL